MADINLPYIDWREGRPRFVAGPGARKLGFKGEDLKHDDGRWLSLEETAAWAQARQQAIAAARGSGKKIKAAAPPRGHSVADMLDDFLAALDRGEPGPNGQPLSIDGIRSYRKAANAIIYLPESRAAAKARRDKERAAKLLGLDPPPREREPFGRADVATIGKVELNEFFLTAKRERGHHMALSMVSVFSAAYTWGGTAPHWRLGANPRKEIKFARPEGRIVIYNAEEFAAIVAAADALGRHSIGDGTFLGVDTGQRQKDRLLLCDEGMIDGRRRFRQSKTRMVVEIKETRRLAARLAEAKARTAALKLKYGTRDTTIVLDETTGRPYDSTTYRHTFAEVRALACKGNNELALTPCPSLQFTDERDGKIKFKTDQDLRDTCVTRLYRAGNDIMAICDITGHSYKSAQTIIDHYLARDRARADVAIDKLEAWMAKEGATA